MGHKKFDQQQKRRLGCALLCAALLHITLFIVIELYFNSQNDSLGRKARHVSQLSITFTMAKKPVLHSPDPISKLPETDDAKNQPGPTEQQTKSAVSEKSSHSTDSRSMSIEEAPTNEATDEHSTYRHVEQSATATATATDLIPVNTNKLIKLHDGGIQQEKSNLDTTKIEEKAFAVYLQQLIEKERRYPRAARKRNIEGSVEFSVEVNKKGSLIKLHLASSSGSRILDKAAEDLLQRVFPVDYTLRNNVRTTIQIMYKLQDV